MMSLQQEQSLKILDSGAGISGVGHQWKITDIEQATEVTIQGAFGDRSGEEALFLSYDGENVDDDADCDEDDE